MCGCEAHTLERKQARRRKQWQACVARGEWRVEVAHVAPLLVLDHVAEGAQLAKGLAVANVLDQQVDLLREVAVDHGRAPVGVVRRDANFAMALVTRDLVERRQTRRERQSGEQS